MLLIENRCPIDKDAEAAWESGSLNAMFEHLISEPIASKYPVTILSRDPWVVTLDDVVSEDEALRLIELGGHEGYERSQDVGAKQANGSYGSVVSTGRTSSNAWCIEDCYKDPIATTVQHRLSELTMINERNSEYLQLLR
jgi:prolyl 4-hydroxylase